jgi:hypothetical protein
MLRLAHSSFWLLTTILKSISAEKHSSAVSLPMRGILIIKFKLGKGTIGRISREVEGDKWNHPGGYPSKFSPCDKQSIIWQITSGQLDNAVQATQFINSTISTPVTPQTVRNVLKEAGLRSATKKKVPMLRALHHQQCLKFAQYHANWTMEDWKGVLWTDETKINWIRSDRKVYVWKHQGNHYQTRPPHPLSSTEGGIT